MNQTKGFLLLSISPTIQLLMQMMTNSKRRNYRKLAEYAIVFTLVVLLHLMSNFLLAQDASKVLNVTFDTPEVSLKGSDSEIKWKLSNIAPTETVFSFEIWRSLDKGESFERIMSDIPVESRNLYIVTDPNILSLTNDEVTYKVRAINTEGFFKYSDEVNFRPRRSGFPIHASVISSNPTSDNLRLHCDFTSINSNYVYVKVLDMNGKVVYSGQIRGEVNNGDLTIDITSWRLGVYFVHIYKDEYSTVEKVIVK